MNVSNTGLALTATVILAACGGQASTNPTPPPHVTSYAFVAPSLNSQRVYSETIVDNASNTINLSYTETVTAVNADGSFVVLQQDPNNNAVVANGTTYAIQPVLITVNNSDQTLSTINTATQVSCAVSPYGAGPTFPVTVGQSWLTNYTITCGASPAIAYQQNGSVVDVESVTVPAGTYSALKLQTTLAHTDANGTIYNQVFATWRDAATGVVIKKQVFNTYSGTPLTNGYPVANTIVLQSGAP